MSVITDTWRGLVQRRLWPVAVLLLAAAAAVPFMLASGSDPAPPPPASGTKAETSDLAAKPIVALASAEERENARRLLGSRKNPFGTAADAKKKQDESSAGKTESKDGSTGDGSGSGSGSGDSKGGSSSPEATATPAPEQKKTYELNELTVRWGESTAEDLQSQSLKRLKALPSNEQPVVIYLGVLEDGETAVFLVDAAAVAQGDGHCNPSPENCQTLHLKAGETEFFDYTDTTGAIVQYQLDLVKIHRARKTASASTAARDLKATAPGGRALLRDRVQRVGRYRYDAESGSLRKLAPKAWKAQAARAARR